MKKNAFLFCAVLLSSIPLDAANSPITDKNWHSHPAIIEVRVVFTEIEDGAKKKVLSKIPMSEPAGTAFIDAAGQTRKFVSEGGSDDSAYTVSQYFDKAGILRFVLVKAGAVNGASAEYRIYFDAAGQKIWENRTITSKQGYTFPESWPEDAIPRFTGKKRSEPE